MFYTIFAPELAILFVHCKTFIFTVQSIEFRCLCNDARVHFSFKKKKKLWKEKKNQLRDFDLIYFRTRASSTSHVSFHEVLSVRKEWELKQTRKKHSKFFSLISGASQDFWFVFYLTWNRSSSNWLASHEFKFEIITNFFSELLCPWDQREICLLLNTWKRLKSPAKTCLMNTCCVFMRLTKKLKRSRIHYHIKLCTKI